MTTRRNFIKSMGLGALALSLPGCAIQLSSKAIGKTMKKKPNILFICTDYQANVDIPREMPFLDMPAVNKLCQEGAVFNKHYSNAPICMPARSCWITGQYPHQHKLYDNRPQWVSESCPILMQELKKSGYYNIGVGKMHFHPIDRMAGFDRRIIADQKEAGWLEDDFAAYLKANGINSNRVYKKDQGPNEFPRIYDYPEAEEMHIDYYVGDQAKQVIEKDQLPKDKPWFMWVSFNGPHSPWDSPAKYSEPYKKLEMPKCNYKFGELESKPANHTIERYIYSRGIMDYVDQYPEKREALFNAMRAAHYGNLTFIDRQIEKIIAALELKGKLENTVIIFSADHGASLGDHDMIHKATHLERSAHVPFVVWFPAAVSPKVIETYTGHVDLLPTILSLTGTPLPNNLEGYDLSPILFGQKEKVRDAAFIEIRNDTSIVTDDYKMSLPSGPWFPSSCPLMEGDLYDRKTDPEEQINQINNPKYKAVRENLLAKILAFNPALKGRVQLPVIELPAAPSVWKLEQGQELGMKSEREPPNQRNKDICFSAKIIPSEGEKLEGYILVSNVYPHGYTIAIKDGQLKMAVRNWLKDKVIAVPAPNQAFELQAELSKEGLFTMKIDGKKVASGQAQFGIPEQPGRDIRFTAGGIKLGGACFAGPLIKKDDRKTGFSGKIKDAILSFKS